MKAESIMTSKPVVVAEAEPIRMAAQLMAQEDIGALPVVNNYRQGRLVGMITDRDIVIRHLAKGGSANCCVSDHMSRGVDAVHPNTDVRDVLGRMAHDQVRRIPVVDANHQVVGVIAQADIITKLGPNRPRAVERVIKRIHDRRKTK